MDSHCSILCMLKRHLSVKAIKALSRTDHTVTSFFIDMTLDVRLQNKLIEASPIPALTNLKTLSTFTS